jgi:hypothetical protein
VTIQDALNDGTYSKEEAAAARLKALADDYETQTPEPRLCYQLAATRQVLLEDDLGQKQKVSMRLSYFGLASQAEDLDFTRSLLPLYYLHLDAALTRPLVLRPYVRLLRDLGVVMADQRAARTHKLYPGAEQRDTGLPSVEISAQPPLAGDVLLVGFHAEVYFVKLILDSGE